MSLEFETIKIEKEGGITWLILNRPEKRNAMSPQLHKDCDEALKELATDPETQVLILTGAGEAYCAGQDLKLFFRGTEGKPKERMEASEASHSCAGRGCRNFRSRPSPWSTASASAAPSRI